MLSHGRRGEREHTPTSPFDSSINLHCLPGVLWSNTYPKALPIYPIALGLTQIHIIAVFMLCGLISDFRLAKFIKHSVLGILVNTSKMFIHALIHGKYVTLNGKQDFAVTGMALKWEDYYRLFLCFHCQPLTFVKKNK